VSTEDALAEALLHGHLDGYPYLLLVLALRDYPVKAPTASQVAGATWRRTVLQALIDYYVCVPNQYPLLRGSLVHSGFEAFRAPQGVRLIREKRMRIQIPKFEDKALSGQIDLYYPDHRRLEDYKSCNHIPNLITPDHLFQLAVYYWLLVWHRFPVDSVAINYIGWDDCRQVSRTLIGMDEGEAIGHWLFQDEQRFIEKVVEGWDVLQAGFQDHDVPSTQECVLAYCRGCPVKWACDNVDEWGERINPDEFKQEEYQ